MAFPAGLTLVTVTGHIDQFPAGGGAGRAIITCPQTLIGVTDNSVVPPFSVVETFGDDGTLSVDLPPCDDPDWSPSDWTYDVTIKAGAGTITGTMSLSVADTTVKLAEVLNIGAPPASGTMYATLSALNALGTEVDGKAGAIDLSAATLPLVVGESVLNRQDVNGQLPLETGTLFLTHFRATKTETITKIRTTTGDTPTLAVGGQHAWIGVMEWDGTNYIPRAISVDDPTRWASAFASYETPISDFHKIAGHDYALEILWIGSGNPPSLPARSNWYADVLTEPRLNALLFTQVAPPSSPLSGAFVGPDSRRFQGILLP